tara:strand:- start:104 stop:322 length:219 start_codon:yes stop_codon:yes gene_type:complete
MFERARRASSRVARVDRSIDGVRARARRVVVGAPLLDIVRVRRGAERRTSMRARVSRSRVTTRTDRSIDRDG